jgi:hypothetical protein
MKPWFLFLCTLNLLPVYPQLVRVSGHVLEKESGEALPYAHIYDSLTKRGTVANSYGYFNIQVDIQSRVRFSFAGYQPFLLKSLKNDTLLNVFLSPMMLESVQVTSRMPDSDFSFSPQRTVSEMKKIPMVGGEPDVIKALATLPGVATGAEGNSNLYVRGGTPDQNLILLDDAPVYYVSHLFGFVSVFNAGALKNVSLLRGSFPARYGGRLSSVVDIQMKEGNRYKTEKEINVGLISSRFQVSGPIGNQKASFFLGGRAAYLGLFFLPAYRNYRSGKSDEYFNYFMYDLNAKMNYEFSKKSQLFVSGYLGHDYYLAAEGRGDEVSRFGLDWGNQTATVRYRTELSPSLFARAIFYHTRYRYDVDLRFGHRPNESFYKSKSSIQDYAGKIGFEWYPHCDHEVIFGLDNSVRFFSPAKLTTNSSLPNINPALRGNELALYLEDNWYVNSRVGIRPGFRYSAFAIEDDWFTALEPRLNIRYRLAPDFSLHADYSRMRQYMHLLTGNSAGFSNDIWVPAMSQAPPQTADLFSVGLSASKKYCSITFDAYYKKMRNVVEYAQGTNLLLALDRPWQ